jgi:hypothetical protein
MRTFGKNLVYHYCVGFLKAFCISFNMEAEKRGACLQTDGRRFQNCFCVVKIAICVVKIAFVSSKLRFVSSKLLLCRQNC